MRHLVIRSPLSLEVYKQKKFLLNSPQMWPDDEFWHPLVFRGDKFSAYFLYEGLDKIVKQKIDIKDQLALL